MCIYGGAVLYECMYLYPPLCVYMVVLYYMSVCNVLIPSSVCVYMVVLYYMSVRIYTLLCVYIYGGAVLYECM